MLGGDLSTGTASPSVDRRSRPRSGIPGERPATARAADGRRPGDDRERAAGRSRPDDAATADRAADDGGPAADRGERGDGPADRRGDPHMSREDLAAEIDDLEQELDAYETRDQRVIDRYERLLAEKRRRQERAADSTAPDSGGFADRLGRRLRRTKRRLLRRVGLQ